MALLDRSMAKLAQTLLKTFGAPITFSSPQAVYDPETGIAATEEDVDPVRTVTVNGYAPTAEKKHKSDGATVANTETTVFVAKASLGDYRLDIGSTTFSLRGVVWCVRGVEEVVSGEEAALLVITGVNAGGSVRG